MTDGMERTSGRRRRGKSTAVILVVTGVLVGLGLWVGYTIGRSGAAPPRGRETAAGGAPEAEVWTCAMHPQIRQPKPGRCPICAMDLVPVTGGGGEVRARAGEIRLSEAARKLAEIETAPVERRRVTVEVRMGGRVEYDETRVSRITAWVPGRLDRLYIDYTGVPVKRGDRMVSLYSPELVAAQEELLQSVLAVERLEGSGAESLKRTAEQTVEAAREKLRLWGLAPEQISEIERRGTAADRVDILAPAGGVVVRKDAVEGEYVTTGTPVYTIADLSRVWVKLDAYESDLVWVRAGQRVEFTVEALPGGKFEGEIAFVDPVLDAVTRTAKARVNVDNPGGDLKPGMFVRAVVMAAAGSDSAGRPPLVVPASAPLVTGERAVVYVEKEPGVYAGVEVSLGPRAGDYYVVREGLEEGQCVVTRGNFKIDSAIQIMAGPSMMNPPAAGHAPRHDVPAQVGAGLDRIYAAYLSIHHGLSRDDQAEAREGADMLLGALTAVDMSLFDAGAHAAYMGLLPAIERHAEAIASAGDIAAARAAFAQVSEDVYALAASFGTGAEGPLRRFHCSMAFDGRGAYWLQSGAEVENPYWGAAMYRCGELVEADAGGRGDGGGERGHD